MLVRIAPFMAAAALAAACSSSSKETRTTATAQGTPVQESPASGSATDIASGSPAGTSDTTTSTRGAIEGPAPRGGSMEGMASARGSPSDRASARGKVANVDPNAGSITLDRDADPTIVVIIDENTRFVGPDGRWMSQGMAAIHEGQEVRAMMDPTSHRAEEIQITRDTGP